MQNLKSKYEQQEMNVSDDFWGKLEQKLEQMPEQEQKPKWIWWNYAAVFLLLAGLSGLFFIDKKPKPQSDFAIESVETQNPSKVLKPDFDNDSESNTIIAKDDSEESKENKQAKIVQTQKPETIKKTSDVNTTSSQKSIENPIEPEQVQLTQTKPETPKEKVKYVSSSDLLFGVEADKVKTEKPKSAMGFNATQEKENPNLLKPKRIKIFGYTVYQKDSANTK